MLKKMTDKGRHEGKEIKTLSFKGGFHGRTDKPAHSSDSTMGTYTNKLASFRDSTSLITVEPNNVKELEAAFKEAEDKGYFIEMALFEHVWAKVTQVSVSLVSFTTKRAL